MNTGSHIAAVAACFAVSALAVLRNMHMFQLNRYKTATHFNWLRGSAAKILPQCVMLLFLIGAYFAGHFTARLIFICLCAAFCFPNRPLKKAKKPLVYTSRVKRILATSAVLFAGAAAASFLFYSPLILIGLYFCVTPVMPVIANAINAPIEAAVRRWYINDAKRILRSCPNLLIIGITGSYGKTSVKYYLTTLLKAKYNVLMTPESYNTPMGVVRTIREQLRATHEIFVCEMGAAREGDIKELCGIANPTHGILTSIGEQHLETFKTVENIIKTKFELARAVAGKGVIFLNGDNAHIRANLPDQVFKTYGLNDNNDYYAGDITVTRDGTSFSMNIAGGERIENLQTKLIGEHNVINLVGAMAMCAHLGVPYDAMRAQMKKISPAPHRLELIKTGGTVIIDDAYNSNPSGCEAALKALALFDGYKILITPGMVELGPRQDALNFTFGEQAAAVCDFVILVGKKQTKAIHDGLLNAGYDASRIYVADGLGGAMSRAHSVESDKPKIILLENDLPDNY